MCLKHMMNSEIHLHCPNIVDVFFFGYIKNQHEILNCIEDFYRLN